MGGLARLRRPPSKTPGEGKPRANVQKSSVVSLGLAPRGEAVNGNKQKAKNRRSPLGFCGPGEVLLLGVALFPVGFSLQKCIFITLSPRSVCIVYSALSVTQVNFAQTKTMPEQEITQTRAGRGR